MHEPNNLRVIEAILFAAPAPVANDILCKQLGCEEADLLPMIAELQQQYAERGVQVVERAGRWTLQTAPDLASYLTFSSEKQAKLSKVAMETLAIIAYHQPITRAEVENIRGVAISKGTLDLLLETGWIKPGRRRDTPGRPLTWLTTDAFLEHFGLAALKDLPGVAELKATGLLDKRPAIAIFPETAEDSITGPADETEDDNMADFVPSEPPDAAENVA